MIINFVGLFNQPGYVGEISDETHLARELNNLGHTVNLVQRDEWKAHVDGDRNDSWNLPKKADINLIAKWHHFNDGGYIRNLAELSGAPVFYWVWDFMPDPEIPTWHKEMVKTADLYLSGELGIFGRYREIGGRPYYFQMDVCDGEINNDFDEVKINDVIFTGSCIDQGHRKEWLQIINKEIPVKIWAWNHEEWQKLGFEAYPAVYGEDYNRLIAQSKIVLGFSVEPNCWGYWSNRIGKVIRAGGFLLQEYALGMETQLPLTGVDYFNSPEEAIEKIKYYLENQRLTDRTNEQRFTSQDLAKRLTILMERYLKRKEEWLI